MAIPNHKKVAKSKPKDEVPKEYIEFTSDGSRAELIEKQPGGTEVFKFYHSDFETSDLPGKVISLSEDQRYSLHLNQGIKYLKEK